MQDNPRGCVIVVNCGSSSLKFALLPLAGENTLFKGLAERLGTPQAILKTKREGMQKEIPIPGAMHQDALQAACDMMGGLRPLAIGHRVVHGGEKFTGAVRIDDEVIAAIEHCAALAPLHNPANLIGIRTAGTLFPDLPQVAVFDTAFHQTLPETAWLYAIPRSFYVDHGIRRYGFHGTSHQYVALQTAKLLGKPLDQTNLITMHLGNGCSACAIRNGQSVDTTMGLSPSEGLVMGTRSGDVDPALHQFLQDKTGMRLSEITAMLNSQSGLLGISGLSNDMRTLADAARQGHLLSRLAMDVFCYRLAKSVGSLMTALDSIDALVFTGGIGENSAEVRRHTLAHMKIFGVVLDEEQNTVHGSGGHGLITSNDSRIACRVVPTNEELMIARETLRLIS